MSNFRHQALLRPLISTIGVSMKEREIGESQGVLTLYCQRNTSGPIIEEHFNAVFETPIRALRSMNKGTYKVHYVRLLEKTYGEFMTENSLQEN